MSFAFVICFVCFVFFLCRDSVVLICVCCKPREKTGANKFRGERHMHITIETDDVTNDLVGYEPKQSSEFYFQQRVPTHVELSSGQFLPGQKPACFGVTGNYLNEFVLKNIHIRHLGTHGLQLNGWENVQIDNIEISPSSKEEWLLCDYAHAQIMVLRLKGMVEEYTIGIPNRYNTHSVSFATFTFSSSKASHGAKLNKIRIHDLYHSFHENVRLAMENAISGASVTPWNSMWSGRRVFGNDENLYEYYNTY